MECYVWDIKPRADFPTPQISGDGMDGVKSMVDGKMYDSKSALRRTYRDKGYIELGNEHAPVSPPKPDKKAREAGIVGAMKKSGLWDQLRD